jgi:hypothetical protein
VSRRYLRPGALAGHLLVLIAALVCLRLGWWQWNVTHETRGTIQNLGYAILWPVFGAAFIFMWLRFLYLEEDRRPPVEGAAADLPLARSQDPALDPSVGAVGTVSVGTASIEDQIAADETDEPAAVDGDRRPGFPQAEKPDPDEAPDSPSPDDDSGADRPTRPRRTPAPSTAVTIAVATVGDDDDDPELTAYNEALARLAEQDRRRAR